MAATGLPVEEFFPVRPERFAEDVLDGLVFVVASIEFAAALSLAETDPGHDETARLTIRAGFARGWRGPCTRTSIRPLPSSPLLAEGCPQPGCWKLAVLASYNSPCTARPARLPRACAAPPGGPDVAACVLGSWSHCPMREEVSSIS